MLLLVERLGTNVPMQISDPSEPDADSKYGNRDAKSHQTTPQLT
jgi:hypothetical protein